MPIERRSGSPSDNTPQGQCNQLPKNGGASLDCARPEGGVFNPPRLTAFARMDGLENPPSGNVPSDGSKGRFRR